MRTFGYGLLLLLGFGGLVAGVLFFASAENAVHEIEALICLLIGAVGVGCATIAASTEAARTEIEVQTRTTLGSAPRQPQAAPGPR
jgi:hypothetical protein